MTYLLCFLLSIVLFKNKCIINNTFNNKVRFFLLFVSWIFVLGLQLNVGTDYQSYYTWFSGNNYLNYRISQSGEFLSLYVTKTIVFLHLHAQWGFVIFASIQFLFFFFFIRVFGIQRFNIFFFVFYCVSTAFVNQTNALRQYTAMYIFLYATVFIFKYQNFWKYSILIIIASLFHHSAIYLLPFYFAYLLIKIKSKTTFLLLSLSIAILLFVCDSLFFSLIKDTQYAYYFRTNYFSNYERNAITIVSKFIYLPFIIHLYFIKSSFLTLSDKWYIRFGTLCYFFKLISLFTFFYGRFAIYFDVISYIPLYYYIYILSKSYSKSFKRVVILKLVILIVLCPYLYKVLIWKKNEYNYNSVIYNQSVLFFRNINQLIL